MFCKNCGNQIPDGVAFCAACGTAAAPAAAPAAAAAAPKADKSNLIKLIAIVAGVAIVLGLFIGLLGGDSPKSVAKDYIEASFEGDLKKTYSLQPGKMQKMFEKETDDEDEMFEMVEEYGEELDVKVKVNNFNQYYKAVKKITKADNKETYGKNYKLNVKVIDVKDMRNSELEAIEERYDSDYYEDYVDADKIKKGKKVYVSVIVDGSEDNNSYVRTVYVVKYKGQWKVSHVGADDRNNKDDD